MGIRRRPTADRRRAVVGGLIYLALWIGLPGQGWSQQEQGTTPVGHASGATAGSYALSDLDHINIFNGSLSFVLPLASIAGRGDTHVGLAVAIEQHWGLTANEDPLPLYWPRFNWTHGSRVSYGPGTLRGYRDGAFESSSGVTDHLTRFVFNEPDGSQHEFRDELTDGLPLSGPANSSFRGRRFKSTDGSTLVFESDYDIYDSGAIGPDGILFFPDGRQARFDQGVLSFIRDRNGNVTRFQHTEPPDPSAPFVVRVTDSTGRQVTVTYASTSIPFAEITWSGFAGTTRRVRINQATLAEALDNDTVQTLHDLFPTVNWAFPNDLHNPRVLTSVTLPNDKQYTFRYNRYGELARVTLPTGGSFRYTHGPGTVGAEPGGVVQGGIYRRLLTKEVFGADSEPETKTAFGLEAFVGTRDEYIDVFHIDPKNEDALLATDRHFYHGRASGNLNISPVGYPPWRYGREFRTETYSPQGALLGAVQHTWQQRPGAPSVDEAAQSDPRIVETLTTLDNGLVSRQAYSYDAFNNRTEVQEYDYGSGEPGGLMRRRHTDFLVTNPVNGIEYDHIRRLPLVEQVFDGAGTLVARTSYEYDNYTTSLMDRPNMVGRASPDLQGTGYTARGNPTSISRWLNTTGAELATQREFDIAGNVVREYDARGYPTSFFYDDRFGEPDGDARGNDAPPQLGGLRTFAFATSVINAKEHQTVSQFDYYLGKPVDHEDVNAVVISIDYNDPLDRPREVLAANNTVLRNGTLFLYDDDNRVVTTLRDRDAFGDGRQRIQVVYDGLGREVESRLFEDAVNYIASLKRYDGKGRLFQVSNPFRPATESLVWTTTSYDALDRVVSVVAPDGAPTITSYSGNLTTVTDAAGKVRQSGTDAIGRVRIVREDPVGLNYQTSYLYDPLDNLVGVTQGGQTRTFGYDSLSRMTSSSNPESGTVAYELYDANGNLLRKRDARGVVTTLVYDELNRPTSRTYSDGTPAVTYSYDAVGIDFALGRLRSVSSSVSATTYTYDALGRVSQSQQSTGGQNYNVGYGYDLAGNLTSETYPSGRVVQTRYDKTGRMERVADARQTYADLPSFAAHGGLKRLRLGNGLWEQTSYNSRLQTTLVGLGTTSPLPNLFSLTLGYGDTNNNGNVLNQTETLPDRTLSLSFSYDALNRLQTAAETVSGAVTCQTATCWSQTYGYDRFGNRAVTAGAVLDTTLTPQALGSYSAATNRLTNTQYDAPGDITRDAAGRTFAYDAENRQIQAGSMTYAYDGEGYRVRKTQGTSSTIYVYDAFDRLIAEYAQTVPQGTSYLTHDALGSLRLVTNSSGSIVGRLDYLPFGEEIPISFAGRGSIAGYGSDASVRQKFTGMERDVETGLDFYGARYCSGAQGRFTSVDPFMDFETAITDPQRWNRYVYANNSPLKYIDPDGKNPFCPPCAMNAQREMGDFLAGRVTREQMARNATIEGIGTLAALSIPLALKVAPGLLASASVFLASPAGHNTVNMVGEALSPVPMGFNPIRAAANLGLQGATSEGGLIIGRLANGAEVGATLEKTGSNLSVNVIGAFNPENAKGSLGTLKALGEGAMNAARAEGAKTVTLRAVAVINSKLSSFLQKQGFMPTKIKLPDGTDAMALERTYQVK